MKLKHFATILITGTLLLSGCGGGVRNHINEANTSDYTTKDQEPVTLSDVEDNKNPNETEVINGFGPIELDEPAEDINADTDIDIDDTNESAEDIDISSNINKPVKPEGIIAAFVEYDNSYGSLTTQIVAINPDSGEQNIISEFLLTGRKDEAGAILGRETFPYNDMTTGNHRNWFSEDFTKMIVIQVLESPDYEAHAGWIDTSGNFFDVTKAIGAAVETDFSSSKPVRQYPVGFQNNNFIFREDSYDYNSGTTHTYYSVPLDDVSEATVSETEYEAKIIIDRNIIYPTAWINDHECLADWYTSSSNSRKPDSMHINLETNEITNYLPNTDRTTWSGVLNSSKDTVALVTAGSGDLNNSVELFTAPLSGKGEPKKLSLLRNEALLFNVEDIEKGMLFDSFLRNSNNNRSRGLFLLEWR